MGPLLGKAGRRSHGSRKGQAATVESGFAQHTGKARRPQQGPSAHRIAAHRIQERWGLKPSGKLPLAEITLDGGIGVRIRDTLRRELWRPQQGPGKRFVRLPRGRWLLCLRRGGFL